MNKINEIESFLGLKESRLSGDYYCVLAGQFSSGKTKFLNKLLGNEYLPVGTREMTAVSTYIRTGEDSAFLYKDAEKKTIPISEIKDVKKGRCDCDRAELILSTLNIPHNLVFIDTPGINSISFEKCDDELYKADAVLYFLAKSISAFDVEMIDSICCRSAAKLLVIRTRIDDIKESEENIYDTYKDEKELILSIFPNARFFFVSLTNDDCNQNQLSELMGYVKYDLINELEKNRRERMKTYMDRILYPALNGVKMKIASSSDSYGDKLVRKTRKQLKSIKKNVLACEEQIISKINNAKNNYFNAGCVFIEKIVSDKGSISCSEIQTYIMKSVRKLELWYQLEFEDIVADISRNGNCVGTQRLVSEDIISRIFDKYEKSRTRFTEFSIVGQDCEEKMILYNDAIKAKDYLKKIFNNIFLRIDADFSESYSERIDSIIEALHDQYAREDELIQKYALNETENINKINEYLLELNKYGKEQEIS